MNGRRVMFVKAGYADIDDLIRTECVAVDKTVLLYDGVMDPSRFEPIGCKVVEINGGLTIGNHVVFKPYLSGTRKAEMRKVGKTVVMNQRIGHAKRIFHKKAGS